MIRRMLPFALMLAAVGTGWTQTALAQTVVQFPAQGQALSLPTRGTFITAKVYWNPSPGFSQYSMQVNGPDGKPISVYGAGSGNNVTDEAGNYLYTQYNAVNVASGAGTFTFNAITSMTSMNNGVRTTTYQYVQNTFRITRSQ